MSRKFLNIKKPTSEDPSLQIKGNGTYDLRDTFRENGCRWNSKDKCWEIVYNVPDTVTTKDLQDIALSTIDAITIAASLQGISVNDTDKKDIKIDSSKPDKNINKKPFGIDFDAIKNTENKYPDGAIIIDRTKTKYYQKFNPRAPSSADEEEDTMTCTINKKKNRIEIRGSTYYNKDWLKKTFRARFDFEDKVWWIDAKNVTLEKIESILDDFGVLYKPSIPKLKTRVDTKKEIEIKGQEVSPAILEAIAKMETNHNHNNNSNSRSRNRKRKYEEYDLSEEEEEEEEEEENNVHYRPRKKRRVIIDDTESEFEMDIDEDIESDDSFIVDDNIIIFDDDEDEDIMESDDDEEIFQVPKKQKSKQKKDKKKNKKKKKKKEEDECKKDVIIEDVKKEEEEEVEDMNNECVICMDGKKEFLCIPCGHLVACSDCKDSIKECPMCRSNCTVIKLFK